MRKPSNNGAQGGGAMSELVNVISSLAVKRLFLEALTAVFL
jgi:hypothetical protein